MYHVVKSSKQVSDRYHHLNVCHDSETESFEDAVKLSEIRAKAHCRDIVVPSPKKGKDGEFWFFTSNGSYVTYFVEEIK